jgi:hypothetical protein
VLGEQQEEDGIIHIQAEDHLIIIGLLIGMGFSLDHFGMTAIILAYIYHLIVN